MGVDKDVEIVLDVEYAGENGTGDNAQDTETGHGRVGEGHGQGRCFGGVGD